MDYLSAAQSAEKWGISECRVQRPYEDGRIDDAVRFSRVWVISKNKFKPVDPRKKTIGGE